ncbi:MAPKKK3 [Symbiodinium sp. CCMP2592]|nr:MAPKKK3 [Symbiodinium sp. CCMP2592]
MEFHSDGIACATTRSFVRCCQTQKAKPRLERSSQARACSSACDICAGLWRSAASDILGDLDRQGPCSLMTLRLSDALLAPRAGFARAGHHPMSSAASASASSAGSAKTACTINVHNAGDTSGYVAYGVERVRAWRTSARADPYQKVKVQPHGDAREKAKLVHQGLCRHLQDVEDGPRVSLSPSTTIPESPVPSSEFEDAVQEKELHRESSVSVERRRCRDRPFVFKQYLENTMPTHRSLDEQLAYELSLYYTDLRGLSNVVQIQTHFYDPSHTLTFVFPDLGANKYPADRCGIVSYMRQMLLALDALWNRDIVHCNIKGGSKPNAIFDTRGKLTLIDFESAVRRHELIDQGQNLLSSWAQTLNYRGNPYYVAPEVLVSQPGHSTYGETRFGRRRDTFSAGIVFAELLLDVAHMFDYEADEEGYVSDEDIIAAYEELTQRLSFMQPEAALSCYGNFVLDHSEFNRLASDLVVKMLQWCRFSRPKPSDLLHHSFFKPSFCPSCDVFE